MKNLNEGDIIEIQAPQGNFKLEKLINLILENLLDLLQVLELHQFFL